MQNSDRDSTNNKAMLDTSSTDIIREKPKKFLSIMVIGVCSVIVVSGLFFFTGIKNVFSIEQSYPLDRVRISQVTRGDFEYSISAEGKLAAVVEPTLFASSEGRVSLLVRPGDKVIKGQTLALIDNPALVSEHQTVLSEFDRVKIDAGRFRLDANIKKIQSQQDLKLAQITYKTAKRKLERYNTEDAQLAISLQDYEAAQDELLIAQAEYENLQSTTKLLAEKLQFDLRAKQIETENQRNIVSEFDRKVRELTVLSPIDGQVGTFHVKEKDLVGASQPLMNVVDLSVFGVEIAMPESYANDLSLAMPVVINYKDSSYSGTLNSISPEVNNNTIEATAVFDEMPTGKLRQNQRVSLKIVIESIPDSLVVQRGPFLQSGAGRQAYVVKGDVATRATIEVGAISGSEVEVLSGLIAGDRIIISDTNMFNNSPQVLLR